MDIIRALMSKDHNLRVSNGDKWLVYVNDMWTVLCRRYRAKKTTILVETNIQHLAIEKLLED